jgi:hypothetical protein
MHDGSLEYGIHRGAVVYRLFEPRGEHPQALLRGEQPARVRQDGAGGVNRTAFLALSL